MAARLKLLTGPQKSLLPEGRERVIRVPSAFGARGRTCTRFSGVDEKGPTMTIESLLVSCGHTPRAHHHTISRTETCLAFIGDAGEIVTDLLRCAIEEDPDLAGLIHYDLGREGLKICPGPQSIIYFPNIPGPEGAEST